MKIRKGHCAKFTVREFSNEIHETLVVKLESYEQQKRAYFS